MSVTEIGPLVVAGFMVGLMLAAVLLRLGKLRSPGSALSAAALPFGCAALPVLLLIAFSVLATASFG